MFRHKNHLIKVRTRSYFWSKYPLLVAPSWQEKTTAFLCTIPGRKAAVGRRQRNKFFREMYELLRSQVEFTRDEETVRKRNINNRVPCYKSFIAY